MSASVILRSVLFFILYNMMGIVHSLFCLIAAPFQTFEQRYHFVNLWTRASMWLLQHLNGVQIEVIGRENIPQDQPVVVMANHQSQWETFYLQLLIVPQATILKRELLWVPFFGWGLALLKPIAINRKKGSQAIKTILRVGKQRLDSGISVVIYPEGTRQPPGTLGKLNGGGTHLAIHAGVPILPVVHNSGDCWPARSIKRFPGTIQIIIGKPIASTGRDVDGLKSEVREWMQNNYPKA